MLTVQSTSCSDPSARRPTPEQAAKRIRQMPTRAGRAMTTLRSDRGRGQPRAKGPMHSNAAPPCPSSRAAAAEHGGGRPCWSNRWNEWAEPRPMQNTAKPEVRAKRGELQISNTLLSLVVALEHGRAHA